MKEIGLMLESTRENNGISINEASEDLKIKSIILENIEDGKIGCFKDIFVLKEYIKKYAKYLGLDPDKIIDEFNEYLFEYTSKIPIKQIEKAINEKKKIKKTKIKSEKDVESPYTKKKRTTLKYILIYIFIATLVGLTILWSVKQIASVNNDSFIAESR